MSDLVMDEQMNTHSAYIHIIYVLKSKYKGSFIFTTYNYNKLHSPCLAIHLLMVVIKYKIMTLGVIKYTPNFLTGTHYILKSFSSYILSPVYQSKYRIHILN